MKKLIIPILLAFSFSLSAQHIIFPNQDLLFPHLNNPSYIGLIDDARAIGMLQITNDQRRQHSQFASAELPLYENLSFGVDYFKDAIEYFNYSTAMASAAYHVNLGQRNRYFRLGVSGGIDVRRQDRLPLNEIMNLGEFVPRINENDIGFTYRAGLHFNWNNINIGGFYNRLPIQNVMVRNTLEDLIEYTVSEGFTASIGYGVDISQTIRITPVARYLSYSDNPIYEGGLLVDIGRFARVSMSYKQDYSINPALRVELFEALQVGYSYEMPLEAVNFEEVHALSISYRVKGEQSADPDWLENAENTIKKIEAIKPKKMKKKKPEAKSEPKAKSKPEPKAKSKSKLKAKSKSEPKAKSRPEPKSEAKSEPEVVKEKPSQIGTTNKPMKNNGSMLETGYYIIVGSYDSMTKAFLEKQRLKKIDYFTNIGKLSGDRKFYLYIDYDKTATNAKRKLGTHKLNKNFRNVSILKVE